MDTIAIVDTSICSDNLGDEIIMDAVNDVVSELFPNSYVFRVPSHEALSDRTRKWIEMSSFCFIGGTNLLGSDIQSYGLWRFHLEDVKSYSSTNTVCLGTGWTDYMPTSTPRTKRILSTSLSSNLVHAARDSYTRDHLGQVGIRAVTTSCPTTWRLTPAHCATIPAGKAKSVIFTLSAWRKAPIEDLAFIDVLKKNYEKVYFFSQMQDDFEYFGSFGLADIPVISPSIPAYNRFLENEDTDFVGTRLHGGIRALQKSRRALILAVDNRAAEIHKDTSLPVISRNNTAEIENWIQTAAPTVLKLPQEAIDNWKAQFSKENVAKLPKPVAAEVTYTASENVKRAVRWGQRRLGLRR